MARITLNGIKFCSTSLRNCVNILPNIVYLKCSLMHSEVIHPNVKKLEELLNLKPILANEIFNKNKKLKNFETEQLVENYQQCMKAGISRKNLLENPEFLTDPKLSSKLNILKNFDYKQNVLAPLLLLSIEKLERDNFQEQIKEKITNFTYLFDITETDVCKVLAKRQFLIPLNLEHVETSIKILTSYGISKEEILRDLWVLKYSVSTTDSRLKTAKENNVQPIKTWMVRAPHLIFENHIRRQSDNKLILGDHSLTEYLSERLECSQIVSKYIIGKHIALQNKSLKKMNEIIDFLLDYGFTKIQICRTPKILLHSVDTIKKRLKEVENHGTKLDTLSVLTKSKKQFDQFLESIKTTKKRKKRSNP